MNELPQGKGKWALKSSLNSGKEVLVVFRLHGSRNSLGILNRQIAT